jgi:hypothetical protein
VGLTSVSRRNHPRSLNRRIHAVAGLLRIMERPVLDVR